MPWIPELFNVVWQNWVPVKTLNKVAGSKPVCIIVPSNQTLLAGLHAVKVVKIPLWSEFPRGGTVSQLCTLVLSDNTKSIVDMEPLWCELELEAVTEDQEILVVPQVLLLVGAALEPQELEANGSSGNGATCTGGTGGSSSIFFLYMWCS